MPQTQICHRLRFVQSFRRINEKTEAHLVASLPKVTTDKYQELGFGLLTQGYDAFSSVYIVSQHSGKRKNIGFGVQQIWVQSLISATYWLDGLGM